MLIFKVVFVISFSDLEIIIIGLTSGSLSWLLQINVLAKSAANKLL